MRVVKNPYGHYGDPDWDQPTAYPAAALEDARHHAHDEGALAGMRALVARSEEKCANPGHYCSVPMTELYYNRCKGACPFCQAELRAALGLEVG